MTYMQYYVSIAIIIHSCGEVINHSLYMIPHAVNNPLMPSQLLTIAIALELSPEVMILSVNID